MATSLLDCIAKMPLILFKDNAKIRLTEINGNIVEDNLHSFLHICLFL